MKTTLFLPRITSQKWYSAAKMMLLFFLLIFQMACGSAGGFSPMAAQTSATGTTSTTTTQYTVNGDAPLRDRAANKGLLFGAAADASYISSNESFSKAFANECGLLVPEWELKWASVRPTPDTFNFSQSDALLDFAQQHNMKFRGHTLVWHYALPPWFKDTVTPQNAEEFLRNHIKTVVGRYAGKVQSWDVVNEAVDANSADGYYTGSPWYQLLGRKYVDIAFRTAAAADPNALLVYNDFGLDYDTPEADAKRAAVLKFLAELKAAGTPVQALGIQGHLIANDKPFNPAKFKAFLSQVASLGLKIIITELDVTDQNAPSDVATRDQVVANAYYEYLTAALSEPAVIGVVTWGLSDGHSWIGRERPRADGSPVRPLPLDANMGRKLAWNAIAKAFDNTFRR